MTSFDGGRRSGVPVLDEQVGGRDEGATATAYCEQVLLPNPGANVLAAAALAAYATLRSGLASGVDETLSAAAAAFEKLEAAALEAGVIRPRPDETDADLREAASNFGAFLFDFGLSIAGRTDGPNPGAESAPCKSTPLEAAERSRA